MPRFVKTLLLNKYYSCIASWFSLSTPCVLILFLLELLTNTFGERSMRRKKLLLTLQDEPSRT